MVELYCGCIVVVLWVECSLASSCFFMSHGLSEAWLAMQLRRLACRRCMCGPENTRVAKHGETAVESGFSDWKAAGKGLVRGVPVLSWLWVKLRWGLSDMALSVRGSEVTRLEDCMDRRGQLLISKGRS